MLKHYLRAFAARLIEVALRRNAAGLCVPAGFHAGGCF